MHPQGEPIIIRIQDHPRKPLAAILAAAEVLVSIPAIPDVDALSEASWDGLVEVPGKAEEARERAAACPGKSTEAPVVRAKGLFVVGAVLRGRETQRRAFRKGEQEMRSDGLPRAVERRSLPSAVAARVADTPTESIKYATPAKRRPRPMVCGIMIVQVGVLQRKE